LKNTGFKMINKRSIAMDKQGIKKVAVIGAGLMGTGIGLEFARFGYKVALYDVKEEVLKKSLLTAREELALMAEAGLIPSGMVNEAMANIRTSTDMADAVAGAGHVVEAVNEDLALKQQIFNKLDELCAAQVSLVSNTSSLQLANIAAGVKNHPERIVTTHYWQPAHMVPLVEVIGWSKADPGVIQNVATMLKGMRKKVIIQPLELPAGPAGWGNAMSWMLTFQAQQLVNGGCSPQVVDDLIKFGFGRRLAYIAIYDRLDWLGLDTAVQIQKANGIEPPASLMERVDRGELGVKSGKGFYDWSGDKAAKFQRDINLELIHLLKRDMERGDI
jgi:3-hydroxybutyryl-CoA dehydrogenase